MLGGRQHRRAAERAGRGVDAGRRCTSSRPAAFSSRRPRRSGRGSRCGSTSPTTTSIAIPTVEAYARGQGAHLRQPDAPRTGRWSTPTIRSWWRRARASRRARRVLAARATARRLRRRRRLDRPAHGDGERARWCRWRRCELPGRHMLDNVVAAAAVAIGGRRRPARDGARRCAAFAASST